MNISDALYNFNNSYTFDVSKNGMNESIKLPKTPLAYLGDQSFCQDYGIKFPYVTGAMANGIASVELVKKISEAGMLGYFGAGGLGLSTIENAINGLQESLGDKPFGMNLIHNPSDPEMEAGTVELYLAKGVKFIEAAAFMKITQPLVRYRLHGIYRDTNGHIVTPNKIMAKVSRVEVATKFLSPAEQKYIDQLLSEGHITAEQAEMAKEIPIASDITAEADSGGHTDNRPALSLLSSMMALKNRFSSQYETPIHVGLAGGISTPQSALAAFSMGASYIVTGSVNQSCVESGSSDLVREQLAHAKQADVMMAPSADMFEMGVKVQVLKRGTMFPMRAAKLYEIYQKYKSIDEIPNADRANLEKNFFKKSLSAVWDDTCLYFETRNPKEIFRGNKDPHHKMALIFRSYLGQASLWANRGDEGRKLDFQVWCGPSMGAFNEWVKDTYLEDRENRTVVCVALNILFGAGLLNRAHILKSQGMAVDPSVFLWSPRSEEDMWNLIEKGMN